MTVELHRVPDALALLEGPVSISLGSSNASGRPRFTRAMGVRVGNAPDVLVIVLPKVVWAPLRADLAENPALACTVANMATLETRQFLGYFEGMEDATEDDALRAEATRAKAAVPLGQFFGPGASDGWIRYVVRPALAVRLRVTHAFDQTPGPRAGVKLA